MWSPWSPWSLQEWVTLSDLTLARTEHGLAVINGIPTVVGGVAEEEFLASVEQLDSSNDQDLAYQRQWRLVAQVELPLTERREITQIFPGSFGSEIRLWGGSDTNQQSQQRPCLQSSIRNINLYALSICPVQCPIYNFTVPRF